MLAVLRREDDRPRRGLDGHRAGAGAARAALLRLPRLPAARLGERRDRAPDRGGPAHRGVGAPAAPVQLATRVPMLRTARREGIRMTVETCPHYLVFEAEAIADGATQFKCCPPIREVGQPRGAVARAGPRRHRLRRVRPLAVHARAQAARRRRVRRGVGRDLVAADRAACRVDRGAAARPLARRRRPVDVAAARARSPGCTHKGRIERGYHADFAVFAPDDAFVVDPKRLHHRNPVTPTRSARWPASCAAPGCAAAGSPATSRGGRLISRGEA